MAPFDPYHKWLGIPPQQQPPDHYRLLGLVRFEPDPEVIASAADARMGHVRLFQSGRHGDVSQRILNELAAARLCLLNPEKKAQYDAALASRACQPAPSIAAPSRPIPVGPIAVAAAVTPIAISTARTQPRHFRSARVSRLRRAGAWIALGALVAVAAGLIAVLATTPDKSRKSPPAFADGRDATRPISATRTEGDPLTSGSQAPAWEPARPPCVPKPELRNEVKG